MWYSDDPWLVISLYDAFKSISTTPLVPSKIWMDEQTFDDLKDFVDEEKLWYADDPFISETLRKRIYYRSFYSTPMDPVVKNYIDLLSALPEIWIADDPYIAWKIEVIKDYITNYCYIDKNDKLYGKLLERR